MSTPTGEFSRAESAWRRRLVDNFSVECINRCRGRSYVFLAFEQQHRRSTELGHNGLSTLSQHCRSLGGLSHLMVPKNTRSSEHLNQQRPLSPEWKVNGLEFTISTSPRLPIIHWHTFSSTPQKHISDVHWHQASTIAVVQYKRLSHRPMTLAEVYNHQTHKPTNFRL